MYQEGVKSAGDSGTTQGCVAHTAKLVPSGYARSTAALVFRLGLQPLAFVNVIVLTVDQFRVAHVPAAAETDDVQFHTIDLYARGRLSGL